MSDSSMPATPLSATNWVTVLKTGGKKTAAVAGRLAKNVIYMRRHTPVDVRSSYTGIALRPPDATTSSDVYCVVEPA